MARMLALVEALSAADWQCKLVTRKASSETMPILNRIPQEIIAVSGALEQEPALIRKEIPNGCDLLIVDHYDHGISFEKAMRGWAKKICVVDDLLDRPHYCHFLVHPGAGLKEADFQKNVPDFCRILTGPEFAILNPEFEARRSNALARRKQTRFVHKVLISFGSQDGKNLARSTLEGLQSGGADVCIDIAIASGAPHFEYLNRFCEDSPLTITVHENTDQMPRLMAEADILFCAGGVTVLEGCCMGIPCMVVETAENQQSTIMGLETARAIFNLGSHKTLTSAMIFGAFKKLSNNCRKRQRLSQNAAAVCDGKGVYRLLTEFAETEFIPSDSKVRLRLVTFADVDTLYKWQLHTETRRYFRNSDIPSYEEHVAWFNRMMNHSEEILYLILTDGEAAGVIRLTRNQKPASHEVSILVDPKRHRQGIGKAALKILTKICSSQTLHAEVHPRNIASRYLFASVGFRQVSETRLFYKRDNREISATKTPWETI